MLRLEPYSRIERRRIRRGSPVVPLLPERAGGDKARGIDFTVDALARGTETHAPIHADLLTKSIILGVVEQKIGNYLLPMTYREGSPMYPFYPAARPTIAGPVGPCRKSFPTRWGGVQPDGGQCRRQKPVPLLGCSTHSGRRTEQARR
jgi:hypothetical protein